MHKDQRRSLRARGAWLRIIAPAVVVGVVAATGAASAQAGASAALEPADQQVRLGEEARLTVRLREAEDLGAFQFTITFPQTVAFGGIDIGPFLGSTGRSVRVFPPLVEAGKATFIAITSGSGPGVSGEGVLATVRLTLEEGSGADIGLSGVLLTDTTGQRRTTAPGSGARLRSGPPPTPTRSAEQMAFLPLALKAASKGDLPVAPSVVPPRASPTSPAPTATPTSRPSPTNLPPGPTASATVAPTVGPTASPGKPAPVVSELQCYGRHEWVKVLNPTGQAIEMEDWSVRSTQGGEVFRINAALSLRPNEVLTIHSGSGAPRGEDRLNLIWTQTTRWNEVDGDTAELTSPFPSSEVVSTMACATPTPRAAFGIGP